MRMSMTFIDTQTVLSVFALRLTGSNFFVGLAESIKPAGWMWPQLLMSTLLEHRPRKMPFYVLGVSLRVASWLAVVLCTLFIGSRNGTLLAATFFCFYAAAASAGGISGIPYLDIISKAIPPQRRARFFSMRFFFGGVFGVFIGFFVKYVLSDKSGLGFPNNYALLFGCTTVTTLATLIVFPMIREPIHRVQTKRKSFWKHLKQGPHFLRTDRHYRRFMLFRVFSRFASVSMPFYAPYVLQQLEMPDSTSGSFLSVIALSGLISNVLWGYIGEKYGIRWVLIATAALACVAPFVAIASPFLPPQWQVLFYFLIFVINSAMYNGTIIGFMTYMLNISPPLNRPTYVGFMNTVLVPLTFVSALGGIVAEWIGYQGVFVIALGMGFLAFFTATRLEDVFYNEEIQSDKEIL